MENKFYTVWHKAKHSGAVWIIDRTYGLKSYAHEIARAVSISGKYTTVLPQGKIPDDKTVSGYINGHWEENIFEAAKEYGSGWYKHPELHSEAARKGQLKRKGY